MVQGNTVNKLMADELRLNVEVQKIMVHYPHLKKEWLVGHVRLIEQLMKRGTRLMAEGDTEKVHEIWSMVRGAIAEIS